MSKKDKKNDHKGNSEKENQDFGPDTVASEEKAEGTEDNFNADAIDPRETSSDDIHTSEVTNHGMNTNPTGESSTKDVVDQSFNRDTSAQSDQDIDLKDIGPDEEDITYDKEIDTNNQKNNKGSSLDSENESDTLETREEENSLTQEVNKKENHVDKGGDRPVDVKDIIKDFADDTEKKGDSKNDDK